MNRKETQRFLNEILALQHHPRASFKVFKEYFEKIDLNGDGFISKTEMAKFVQEFFNIPVVN